MENGNTVEYNLCEICASQTLGNTLELSGINKDILGNISDMLAGYSYANDGDIQISLECPSCGTSSAQFQKTGRLGCDKCYDTFEDKLTILLKRLQGTVQHAGKSLPGSEKRLELERLQEELHKSVEAEEYERAAVLRDRIKSLKDENNG